jgi:membrane protein HdeD
MQKMVSAIVLIVLGLIVLAFPLLGVVPAALITGFVVLIFGLGLIFNGISEMEENMGIGLTELLLGIMAFVLGIGITVNPGLFAMFISFIVFIVGLFLLIAGIMVLLTKSDDQKWNGVLAIIIGILYMIMGNFVSNPIYLGILIAIWLIISGILMLFQKD